MQQYEINLCLYHYGIGTHFIYCSGLWKISLSTLMEDSIVLVLSTLLIHDIVPVHMYPLGCIIHCLTLANHSAFGFSIYVLNISFVVLSTFSPFFLCSVTWLIYLRMQHLNSFVEQDFMTILSPKKIFISLLFSVFISAIEKSLW